MKMDFTYEEYKRIITLLKEQKYQFTGYLNEYADSKNVILRHDVDLSLDKALEFAKFENSLGVTSTYYILLSSYWYNIIDPASVKMIKAISELGHDIGLHFDESKYAFETDSTWKDSITAAIVEEARLMRTILGDSIEIASVSMHIPSSKTLGADLQIDGLINSYGKDFFENWKYVSDSNMNWREDVFDIIRSGDYSRLHILTHPFWYEEQVREKKEKVEEYINIHRTKCYREMKVVVPELDALLHN